MKSEEWEQNDSSRDLELDRPMAQAMSLKVPEELIHRTMQRVSAGATSPATPFPWWAWLAYAVFFAGAVAGLAYWQWEALASGVVGIALSATRAAVLAVQHPSLAAAVAGAFLANAVMAWFLAAELVLRRRFSGVVAL